MTDDDKFEADDIPQAEWVRVYWCDAKDCRRPHILLFNEAGKPFAQFVLPDGGGFIKDLQNAAYMAAMMRDD